MTSDVSGSCQCGRVTYRVSGQFEHFFLCYCSRCQKDTGSGHAANLLSTTAQLVWLSGDALIKTYRVPETRHQKSFCSECGAPVPMMQMDGELLVVPAGSLDQTITTTPDARIFHASRPAWADRLEQIHCFAEGPG
ncbi:GFA family protein [Pseudovibrio exalbescens]|uniref:GFA family protein n=1 Tax=Pseudovibrio exalbescens TaxID=197461 RepID=UPI000C9A7344|nr:GFA family protein [Pseudovibrio exalbescens]